MVSYYCSLGLKYPFIESLKISSDLFKWGLTFGKICKMVYWNHILIVHIEYLDWSLETSKTLTWLELEESRHRLGFGLNHYKLEFIYLFTSLYLSLFHLNCSLFNVLTTCYNLVLKLTKLTFTCTSLLGYYLRLVNYLSQILTYLGFIEWGERNLTYLVYTYISFFLELALLYYQKKKKTPNFTSISMHISNQYLPINSLIICVPGHHSSQSRHISFILL